MNFRGDASMLSASSGPLAACDNPLKWTGISGPILQEGIF